MDSDDEFMSGSSQEEDFGGTQESDDGSLGDGQYLSYVVNPALLTFEVNSEPETVEFEDDNPDVGFTQDKEIIKSTRKPYEVDFKVFAPADIQAYQDKQIEEVSAILGQPSEATAILLRHLRWNKDRLI